MRSHHAAPRAPRRTRVETSTQEVLAGDARDAFLLVDSGVVASEAVQKLIDGMPGAAQQVVSGPGTNADAQALAGELARRSRLVAVGGGAVLDRAKTATLLAAGCSPETWEEGAAHVDVPLHEPTVELTAVPTTLGTGSERNANAVVGTSSGRVLVSAPAIQPQLAVVDPVMSRTLGPERTRAGVFEAALRCLGPSVGCPSAVPGTEEMVLAATTRLVALGRGALPGGPGSDRHRAEIASLSALGHGEQMHAGRHRRAFLGWYLAHELSELTGFTKVEALAAVTPAWFAAVLDGDPALGGRDHLKRLWSALARSTGLPKDPARGVRHLAQELQVRAPVSSLDPGSLTERLVRRWGPLVPALATGRVRQVQELSEGVAQELARSAAAA